MDSPSNERTEEETNKRIKEIFGLGRARMEADGCEWDDSTTKIFEAVFGDCDEEEYKNIPF